MNVEEFKKLRVIFNLQTQEQTRAIEDLQAMRGRQDDKTNIDKTIAYHTGILEGVTGLYNIYIKLLETE